jgi:hypothetical protein
MSFPNPDNYGRSCECGPTNSTPPPSAVQNQIDALDTRTTTLEGDVTTIEGDVTSLDTRVTTLENTNDVIVSSGGIAALTVAQQNLIHEGSIVVTTDGKRWVYSGTGSKTSEGSYVQLSDITPVSPINFENGGSLIATDNDGTAGTLNLSAGSFYGVNTGTPGNGGSILLVGANPEGGGAGGNAGSINLSGGATTFDNATSSSGDGGDIFLIGGAQTADTGISADGGDAGSINLSGGDGYASGSTSNAGGPGGSISLRGGNGDSVSFGGVGGSITSDANDRFSGGSINLSAVGGLDGGSIDLSVQDMLAEV